MSWFGRWIQQLWAESLAKKIDNKGKTALRTSTPMPCLGAMDQHSLLQQFMEGANDKYFVFLKFSHLLNFGPRLQKSTTVGMEIMQNRTMGELLFAEAKATRQALEMQGRHTIELELQDTSIRSIGYLFMFFQLVVAGLGQMMDINAFDQPGVELGKRLAKEILLKR
jgi:glucose-6-phosphate isomerase